MRIVMAFLFATLAAEASFADHSGVSNDHVAAATPGETACLSSRDAAGREPCLTRAQDNEPRWICSLQSVLFHDCLASMAGIAVRADPAQPKAGVVYRLHLRRRDGSENDLLVLAAREGHLDDRFDNLEMTIITHTDTSGSIAIDYRFGNVIGSRTLAIGQSAAIKVGDAEVTIQRL